MSVNSDVELKRLKKKIAHSTDERKKKKVKFSKPISIDPSTQHLKVTITHEHRHRFASSNVNDDNANDQEILQQSLNLISEAQRLEKQNTVVLGKSDEKSALSALQSLSAALEKTDSETMRSALNQPEEKAPAESLNTDEQSYGSEPLFAAFVPDDLFDALNRRLNVDKADVSAWLPEKQSANADAPQQVPERTMQLNKKKAQSFAIDNVKHRVDVDSIVRKSFDELSHLTPLEQEEARALVRVTRSEIEDSFADERFERLLYANSEHANQWARVYRQLDRSGNAARREESTKYVSEKAETFVRSSPFRKQYFQPHFSDNCPGITFMGSHNVVTMIESPHLFLMPNSGMWNASMTATFGRTAIGDYLEFVDFERSRVSLVNSDPFIADQGWMLWKSCCDTPTHCVPGVRMHSEVQSATSNSALSPNVKHYEKLPQTPGTNCACAENGTIVLCCRATHMHTLNQQRCPVQGQRSGDDNPSVVAAGVFGAASRERWMNLQVVCASLPTVRHSSLLVDAFIAALRANTHLAPLVECILEFGVDNQALLRIGKPHDVKRTREIVNKIGMRRTEKWLAANSHARERFYLYDPIALTLALQLFVEATMEVGWINVCRVWFSMVQTHCYFCPFCSRSMTESLYRLVVYNAMLPILPVTMSTLLEQFALSIRFAPRYYR